MRNYKLKFMIKLICFLTICLNLIGASITVYAVEVDSVGLDFNSVVEIENYEIKGNYIEPGKEAEIELTIKNDNTYSTVKNLVAVFSSGSGAVYPAYGNDNQFFIGNLEPNSSKQLLVPIAVASTLTGDYVDFTCNLIYEIAGNKISSTSTLALPTSNVANIVVNSVNIGSHATVNGRSLLSISYSNHSTGNINDAVLVIDGNVNEATREIELGSILSGKSYTKDYNLVFSEDGEQPVNIKLRYTDVNGEKIDTNIGVYKVNVSQGIVTNSVEKTDNELFDLVGKILAAVSLTAVIILSLSYIIKR